MKTNDRPLTDLMNAEWTPALRSFLIPERLGVGRRAH